MMTRQELEQALDRHGAEMSRWPPETHDAAERLIAADTGAAALVAAAAKLDRSLAVLAAPTPFSSADVGRVIARARRGRTGGSRLRPGFASALAAGALVLCLGLGFALGLALPPDDNEAAIAALIFGNGPAQEDLL